MKYKVEKILQTLFTKLYNRMEKKHKSVLDVDKDVTHLLRIPLVGGMLYILRRYKDAHEFNRYFKMKSMKNDKVRGLIREENVIKNSIRTSLEEYQMVGGVKEVHIEQKYRSHFRETLREFPDIVCSDLGGGDYVLTLTEDI